MSSYSPALTNLSEVWSSLEPVFPGHQSELFVTCTIASICGVNRSAKLKVDKNLHSYFLYQLRVTPAAITYGPTNASLCDADVSHYLVEKKTGLWVSMSLGLSLIMAVWLPWQLQASHPPTTAFEGWKQGATTQDRRFLFACFPHPGRKIFSKSTPHTPPATHPASHWLEVTMWLLLTTKKLLWGSGQGREDWEWPWSSQLGGFCKQALFGSCIFFLGFCEIFLPFPSVSLSSFLASHLLLPP